MAKVLVIDDSALMRKHLRSILEQDGYEIETARNGQEGIEKTLAWNPDVITLDINMPVMDGITCLSEIMQHGPRAVLMVSSLTEKGALATFEALELGALDYVHKPGGTVSLNIQEVSEELRAKVKQALRVTLSKSTNLRARLRQQRQHHVPIKPMTAVSKRRKSKVQVVVIGVSTGGPGAIQDVLTQLPGDFPVPIVIAQHMPGKFTQVFAQRLNKLVDLEVQEVTRPTQLQAGHVYIARGDADIKFSDRNGKKMVLSIPADSKYLWHPSVEKLVHSAGEVFDPKHVLCVQLTGMGNDGAKAMKALNERGAMTIAEAESSAVVFGMPKELIELNGADKILDLSAIPKQMIAWVE